MAYIGRTPQIGAYHKLDSITCDGSTAYTMQLDSANFVPESSNHLIVSVNGVIQAPTDSFTVSSSTITFASALSSSDTIDFIMALGNVLDIGTPSDATVSFSKLDSTNQSFLKSIPQSGSAKTSSYTLTTSDLGSFIEVGSSGSITIPDATFNAGNAISLFNNTTGDITITCSITTAYISGTNADKSTVTLATRGVATILFISGTVCVISGNVS